MSLNWRLYNVEVLLDSDPGKGCFSTASIQLVQISVIKIMQTFVTYTLL